MITVILCDDNEKIRMIYNRQITRITEKHGIEVKISNFESGKALVFHLSNSPGMADIIYLDILMDSQNGIETAQELRKLGSTAEIVFLTSSEDYVFDAFDISPVQYLIKDSTSHEKFEQVFLRAVSLVQNKKSEMFVCEASNISKMIPIKDISYFEILIRVVIVHYQNGETFKFYSTMKQLESQLLSKNFIRVHRSFLVNLQHITKFQAKSLILSSGDGIPIGATYSQNVRDTFSKYIAKYHIYD